MKIINRDAPALRRKNVLFLLVVIFYCFFSSLNILKFFNSAATLIIYRSLSHNIKGFEAKIKMLIM